MSKVLLHSGKMVNLDLFPVIEVRPRGPGGYELVAFTGVLQSGLQETLLTSNDEGLLEYALQEISGGVVNKHFFTQEGQEAFLSRYRGVQKLKEKLREANKAP